MCQSRSRELILNFFFDLGDGGMSVGRGVVLLCFGRVTLWAIHWGLVKILSEAGGILTDGSGIPFDFSSGRSLSNNARGIIAANSIEIHQAVLSSLCEARVALGDTAK